MLSYFFLYFTFTEFLNFQFWSSRKIPKNAFSKCDICYHSKIISKIMKRLQNEFSNFVSKYFYLVHLCDFAVLVTKNNSTFVVSQQGQHLTWKWTALAYKLLSNPKLPISQRCHAVVLLLFTFWHPLNFCLRSIPFAIRRIQWTPL